jgi:dipeptide/tripeptide permease
MNGAAGVQADVALKQRTFLGHPIGLYILFFTEMWERFSYYGMRALLVLYMVNYFKWAQKDASGIYKWYTSLVYLTPLLGGYLADRYLGNKRAVIIGAVLMAVGHFLMAFEAYSIFTAALIFLILGNGFFKPNMSAQVGRLYPQNDARRDGAYTIFYMGINLGAFLSPLICGWLAANTVGGYHTGFTMAGIGMVLGLVIYLVGMRWVVELNPDAKPKPGDPDPAAGAAGRADSFAVALRQLQKTNAETGIAQVRLGDAPPAFDPTKAGLTADQLRYDQATGMLTATAPLTEAQIAALVTGADAGAEPEKGGAPMSEAQAEKTPSVLPWLTASAPWILTIVGAALALGTLVWAGIVMVPWIVLVVGNQPHPTFLALAVANNTLIGLGIVAVCSLISSWIVFNVKNAERDRVLAIYALGVFVVFFWAAFEQAGNALNLWADKTTNRYLTAVAPEPSAFPETPTTDQPAGSEAAAPAPATGMMRWITMWQLKPTKAADANQSWWQWFAKLWNPVATEWFQSINALAIFILAPLFAMLWVWLERSRMNPSTPVKMAIGVLLMSSSFGLMIFAGRWEDQPTSVTVADGLPKKILVNGKGQLLSADEERPYQGGRLTYDPTTQSLNLRGVLPDTEHDLIVRETAPDDYAKALKDLQKQSQEATPDAEGHFAASVHLERVPPGFDLHYAGFDKSEASFDEKTQTLIVRNKQLADKDVKALLVAGGDEKFRKAIDELYTKSAKYQVSSWWLFWFYILSTLGELCLSPVGLSMVSKLAPARFATMLMGLWLLTSFFGNFAAGQLGESWSSMAPVDYFIYVLAALAAAAVVLFVLVRLIKGMMHGVK